MQGANAREFDCSFVKSDRRNIRVFERFLLFRFEVVVGNTCGTVNLELILFPKHTWGLQNPRCVLESQPLHDSKIAFVERLKAVVPTTQKKHDTYRNSGGKHFRGKQTELTRRHIATG